MTALFNWADNPAWYWIPIGMSVETSVKGKWYLFFGKNVAPNSDINSINAFILRLFREWSPLTLTLILGVVDSMPIKSLARVPELPKFNSVIFFASKDPRPFP